MRFAMLVALTFAATHPLISSAQSIPEDHAAHHAAASAAWVNAEVRRIDKASGKVTLRHDAIPNLEMPNMTMVFAAKTPQVLDTLQVGDKVRFIADKVNGQYIATTIERMQ